MRWQHLVPVFFITACGRSSADSGVATSLTPSTTDPLSARYFSTNTDLPSCDASTDHWLVFVASIKTFKTCTDGTWIAVDVSGPAGPAGYVGLA